MAQKGVRSNEQRQRERGAPKTAKAPGRKRIIGFGAVTLAVLLAAAYFLWPAVRTSTLFSGAEQSIEIAVSMAGFSPSRIATRAGEPLTIRLVNKDNRFHTDGGGWHQFAIDELGVDVRVPPLATRTITFTPKETGVFDFFCDVCCGGRANPYMHGALTVTA